GNIPPSGFHGNRHDGGVVAFAIEKLAAVSPPARHGTPGGGDLPFASSRSGDGACTAFRSGAARKGHHINLFSSRFVGGVGNVPPVGREGGIGLFKFGGEKRVRFLIASHRMDPDIRSGPHVLLPFSK